MAIKFVCSCGKRLRAREEMAARRVACPRCGAPVGIPSLRPNHEDAALGPMTPAQRLQARLCAKPLDLLQSHLSPRAASDSFALRPERLPVDPADAGLDIKVPRPPDPHIVRQVVRLPAKPSSQKRVPELEARWYHCLLYPVRSIRLVLALACILTVVTGGIALVLPELLEISVAPMWMLLIFSPCLLVLLLPFSYACAFLQCVLAYAKAGQFRHTPWPGRDVGLVLKSGLIWVVCFLAGPVLPAGTGLLFWIHCGEMTNVDRLILAELAILSAGYWLLALLAVDQRNRLRDANPVRVADLVHRLGHRLIIAALLGSVLIIGHGFVALLALQDIHLQPASGWLWLSGCWLSAMIWATALFRLLGVWCHQSARQNAQ